MLTESDFMEYAVACGTEAAYGLVLLAGPDGIEGGWEVYQKLEKKFMEGLK